MPRGCELLGGALEKRQAILEAEGTGRYEGAVLAEAVAGHTGWTRRDFVGLDGGSEARQAGGKDRRLGELGVTQAVYRSFEADLAQAVAEDGVGRVEDLPRGGGIAREIMTHADLLRTLAGKQPGGGRVGGFW
jgi:hypothetical protein